MVGGVVVVTGLELDADDDDDGTTVTTIPNVNIPASMREIIHTIDKLHKRMSLRLHIRFHG